MIRSPGERRIDKAVAWASCLLADGDVWTKLEDHVNLGFRCVGHRIPYRYSA